MKKSAPSVDSRLVFSIKNMAFILCRLINRLKIVGLILTIFGVGLFAYFVYAVGFHEIFEGVKRFGFAGFGVIVVIYFPRGLIGIWQKVTGESDDQAHTPKSSSAELPLTPPTPAESPAPIPEQLALNQKGQA